MDFMADLCVVGLGRRIRGIDPPPSDVTILNGYPIAASGASELNDRSRGATTIEEESIRTPKVVEAYAVQLFFAGASGGRLDADLRVVVASEDFSGLDVEMLPGRDVPGRCLIVFNGPVRRFTLASSPPATPS